jgi:hypothetical protein
MSGEDGTLYLNPARQQFYWVPMGQALVDGVYLIVPLTPWPGRPRDVNRVEVEAFAIERERAQAILAERYDTAVEDAKGLLDQAVGQAKDSVGDRDLPGGSTVKTLGRRFGRLLARPEVEKGLSLLGGALTGLAGELKKQRETSEAHPAPGEAEARAGTHVVREDELTLCGRCLTSLDEDPVCPSCGADPAEVEPFVMSAAEFAEEPWKSCPKCQDEMLRLAAVCPSCGAKA